MGDAIDSLDLTKPEEPKQKDMWFRIQEYNDGRFVVEELAEIIYGGYKRYKEVKTYKSFKAAHNFVLREQKKRWLSSIKETHEIGVFEPCENCKEKID